MDISRAKTLALRLWEEGWNKGHLDVVDEVLAPDALDRHQHHDADFRGHLRGVIREFRTGFPDLHTKVEDIVAEGDRLAMRVILTGTQDGPFLGVAPTGKKVEVEQYHFVQVNRQGQGVRHWAHTGIDELIWQLSPPNGATA